MSGMPRPDTVRRRWGSGVAMAGVLMMGASLWLPWHISGERSRDAFELLQTADWLDLGPGPFRAVWRLLVPVVPALAAVAWISLLLGRRRLFLASGWAVAGIVGIAAVVVAVTQGTPWWGVATALLGFGVAAIGWFGPRSVAEAERPRH